MNIISSLQSLTKFERILWIVSVIIVTLSFLLSGNFHILTITASLVGVSALIFVAKGDTLGQIMTIIFALLYAVVSYENRYYGEMITYLGMTAPMALLAVVSWLKHSYDENTVEVAQISRKAVIRMIIYTVTVTIVFYFILKYFNTASLTLSTISIATSFLASYLTYSRSPFYALAYSANDIVLIGLWIIAAMKNVSYLPMVACFLMFLLNDLYGFYNWCRMKKQQQNKKRIP